MIFSSYTLSDEQFGFDVHWSFPEQERIVIENAIRSMADYDVNNISNLDHDLGIKLFESDYLNEQNHKENCQLWLPDFKNSVDLYKPSMKIAIEIEKTEKKRILHDILKFINGSITFVPKIEYGVLIIPKTYKRSSGKESSFFSTVKKEVPFYLSKIFESSRLKDILFIVYEI